MRPPGRQLLLTGFALLTIGASSAPAKQVTPSSLVVGDLVSQKYAPGNPCEPDEDLCMDAMIESRLSDVRVLAGNRTGATLRFRHRMHVPYRRGFHPLLAAVVLPASNGMRRGVLIGVVEDGKVCLSESWFQPGEDLLPIPRGHSINSDKEVCFYEGHDF